MDFVATLPKTQINTLIGTGKTWIGSFKKIFWRLT
jgi:hypothetical protein